MAQTARNEKPRSGNPRPGRKTPPPAQPPGWIARTGTPAAPSSTAGRLKGRSPEEKRALFESVGTETARLVGGDIVGRMIRDSGLSLARIEEMTGFSKSSLSKMANGVYETGPTLWKLFALADALGYRLDFSLAPRDGA